MAKFETVNVALYRYLIEELEENIMYAEQRIKMLTEDDDYQNAIFEEKYIQKSKEKLKHLQQYLEEELKSSSNVPYYIEISHFDRYTNKITTEDLNCYPLDEEASNYYYTKTDIKLRDWIKLEDGVEYKVGNLTIKRDGKTLLSIYPTERMWHELNENFEADKFIFENFGDKEVYIKN